MPLRARSGLSQAGPGSARHNRPLIDSLVASGRLAERGGRFLPTLAGLAVADSLARSFDLAGTDSLARSFDIAGAGSEL